MRPTSPDHNGGKLLLAPLAGRFPRMKLIWADSGYKKGGFCEWVKATLGWTVEIVEYPWTGIRSVWVPEGVEVDWEKIRPRGFRVLNTNNGTILLWCFYRNKAT